MKKRLLAIILVTVVLISAAAILYYTSYPVISVGKMVSSGSENFKEFHGESVGIWAAGTDFLPDSPVQKRKLDEVFAWNNSVVLELAEHVKDGGEAYNITVSGEIENGKTTLRYEGYIIKSNGKRIDYKEEKTFNFALCSEKRFFTEKL